MLGSLGTRIIKVQLVQVRFGHRMRGNPPIYARSLKQRLEELNYKDEVYTTKIDIGFPRPSNPSTGVRTARTDHIKKIKADNNLEQLARHHKLLIDLKEVRKEWLQTLGPAHKKDIADHYGVFEHLYGEGYFIPYTNLNVYYEQADISIPVYHGNVVKPSHATEQPVVEFESDKNSLWTLALTNLDGNLTENDKEYVHWLVANIPGNCVEKGDTVVEYLQPFPFRGTGYHRYVFVLYKQDGKMSYDLEKVSKSSPLEKRSFVTRDWYKAYQDHITPATLAFFQSDWDSSLKDLFHHTFNMKEPVFEYDFPAPYIRPQEWFPRRRPFNLYMDKYRDPKQINKEYLLRKLANERPLHKPEPPLKYPNAQYIPSKMPSWLKLHEKKIKLGWGRVNDV